MIRKDRRPRETSSGGDAPNDTPADDATVDAVPAVGAAPTTRDPGRGRSRAVPASAGAVEPTVPDAETAGSAPTLPPVAVAGFSRKRLAWFVACVVAGWILLTFARQVGEAADATARADLARAENGSISAQVDRLRAELAYIQQPRFVAQQARAYGIGGRREHPFTLQVGAPALPADAPGSASQRIGYRTSDRTPIQAWIQVLFGPSPGS